MEFRETDKKFLYSIIDRLYKGNPIKTIFDLWARYCEDSIDFSLHYTDAKIYSFECNPNVISKTRNKVKNFKNITLVENAVSDKDWPLSFYPINKEKTITTHDDWNQWASSLLLSSGKYDIEKYVQDKITVQSIRLDDFVAKKNILNIDLIWMDLQWAEIMALNWLWKFIKNVNFIYTEVEFIEIYKDQPLFRDVQKTLEFKWFVLIKFFNVNPFFSDVLFVNKKILKNIFWYRFVNIFYVPMIYIKVLFLRTLHLFAKFVKWSH